MSLNDLNKENDYDEILPKKKGRKGKLGGVASKTKMVTIILIIGILIGVLAGHYYIEPAISGFEGNTNKDCLASKELLTKENDCLYNSVDNPKQIIENCLNTNQI